MESRNQNICTVLTDFWREREKILELVLYFSQRLHFLTPTVTLNCFCWPTLQPVMHTKITQRLQSSSHLGDTNGMIDTNVSRANCTKDAHTSDRAERCVQPITGPDGKNCCGFFGEHEWLLLFF